MKSFITRPLAPEDGEAAAEIFFDAVRNGTADVYSLEQRIAWGGEAPNPAAWVRKFAQIDGFAAVVGGTLVGFMTLDDDGYIDLAFVRSDFSGCGIGQAIYTLIEAHAAAQGIETLTTEASKKAKPFFARMGWRVDQEQIVVKNNVSLRNFKMSKLLRAAT